MFELLEPDWSVPGVTAFTTTRAGGHSTAPWDSFNLGDHVGDDPAAVAANREALASLLPRGSRVQWLRQVHGTRVVKAGVETGIPDADASWSNQPGAVCSVMTADCLPVLFASRDGRVVAAAHAGWRGLLDGVLEATVAAMPVDSVQIIAWMGPSIGPEAFELGPEVYRAFIDAGDAPSAFRAAGREGHYLGDMYALARGRLQRLGVTDITGGGLCTFNDPARFYSYRRDGEQSGRMATVICINPGTE
ncbi:peptidoglycan editing factor PgeF [Haliea sp. E17]|uniref:peptidoglycan editing factor PgeF n=1 Tax=Haliea sp. E17 TaxID=3401576 RepID=UPI003AAF3570